MKESEHVSFPSRLGLWLFIMWLAIILKCLSVPWVVQYWEIPIKPFWIVLPTLVFAVVVTALVLVRQGRGEPKG